MPFLTPSKQEEILGELKLLAELLSLNIIEAASFPTVMVRVSLGDKAVTITKQGSDYLATDILPDIPMTFVGGGMFNYRLEV
jgi:hypothetical protein